MEDYDEIQSQGSGGSRSGSASRSGSGSPVSGSPSNGRITVTVASMPSLPAPPMPAQNSLTLALPIQPYNKSAGGGLGGVGGSGGGGREDCWSEGATAVLIDAWGERYLELSRGNLKQMHWKEVADIVNSRDDFNKTPKTDIQCKNRIDTVKKKYKSEKAKIVSGGAPSKWLFYDRLDHLIGPTAAKALATTAGPSSSSRVPVAIPVSLRSGGSESRFHIQKHQPPPKSKTGKTQSNSKKPQFRRSLVESDEEDDELEEELADSDDSLPPEKKPRVIRTEVGSASKDKKSGSGNSLKLLTQAILKFGEAYEAAESAKLQQVMEMEKQRMKFAKDMELQRTQLLMKTQLEISQMKHGRRGGNNNTSNNHHSNNNNNNNHSDSN